MRHTLLTLSLFLAVAVVAPAQVAPPRPADQPPPVDLPLPVDPPKVVDPAKQVDPPKAAAPQAAQLTVSPDGRGFVRTVVTQLREVKEQIQVNVNGRIELRERTVKFPVAIEVQVGLHEEGVEVYDANGAKVDGKVLRFKAPVTVWMSVDGKRVDPTFHKLVQPGQFIVVATSLANTAMFPVPKTLPAVPNKVERR